MLILKQHEYLKSLGKRSSGQTWFSKLIRKTWLLQKKMWDHRNGYLHKNGSSLHDHEVAAMDRTIRWEFAVGLNGLPPSYSGLFQGTVGRVLRKNDIAKTQWLNSVWLARDNIRMADNLDPWDRDPIASTFVQRATIRAKRRRRAD